MSYHREEFPDTSRATGPHGSDSEGSAYEMKPWPPSHYSSQVSMTPSHKSILSTYTPSQASYVLPIVSHAPDPRKKAPDNAGFALCSMFCNPILGFVAIVLSERSKNYYNRCQYIKAAKYGSYAKGAAMGGILATMFVLLMIIAQVIQYHVKFNY